MTRANFFLNMAFGALVIFLATLILIIAGTPRIDNLISDKINSFSPDYSAGFFFNFNFYLGWILLGIAVCTFLILIFQNRRRDSFILLASLVFGYILGNLIKFAVQRARPSLSFVQEMGYSFPSNHVLFATILFFLLIYFFAENIKNNFLKNLFIFVNFLFVLFTGFSRIFLNVHWFTDVVGGFVLGIIIACVAINYSR